MFGIGLPEMIVILAVALIVVGPDKLPDMARSLAKGVFELKKTLNQVKDSLADEDNLIGSVQSDLRKTADDLKTDLVSSDHFTPYEPGGPKNVAAWDRDDVIDVDDPQAELVSTDGEETTDTDSSDSQDAAEAAPEPESSPEPPPVK